MSDDRLTDLPEPDGVRGSGEPWWYEGIRSASVTPTAPWNRDDEEVPTVTLVNVQDGNWGVAEARRLALAVLAACVYVERTDQTGDW